MDFGDLGNHCAVSGCGRQDFLPFTCDYCKLKLCLQHKNYENHECAGLKGKSMTSIDCPICSKSVKFTENQNADEIWAQHYSADCTKKPAPEKSKQSVKCAIPLCSTTLGISNSYECPKCKIKVCLPHRMPEDHGCSSTVTSSSMKPGVSSSSKFGGKRGKGPQVDPNNTLRGTSERRRQQMTADWACSACTTSNSYTLDSCHLCKTRRIIRQDDFTEDTVAATSDYSVCPFCSARYSDPVDLIAHVEEKHNSMERAEARGTDRTPSKNAKRKCICS